MEPNVLTDYLLTTLDQILRFLIHFYMNVEQKLFAQENIHFNLNNCKLQLLMMLMICVSLTDGSQLHT